MKTTAHWRKLDGAPVLTTIEDEVRNVLIRERAMGTELKVCIGTDSQLKAGPKHLRGKRTDFATVIVFIRKGRGGFMYLCTDSSTRPMSVKERMLAEVAKSIEVAYSLSNLFTFYHVDLEVHADINTNPNFKSNDALKEAMGYITGMGFAFKAKPFAFASTSCANKIVQ